jgi:hypothetical protein
MSSLADRLKSNKSEEVQAPLSEEDSKATETAIAAKAAHILALEQGIRCFKDNGLKTIILRNGNKVKPTAEGHFIALNAEIEEQLDHFAKHPRELVLELKPEDNLIQE